MTPPPLQNSVDFSTHFLTKDIPLSLFWAGYVEGYDILILGIFKVLSYPISFIEKNYNFWVLLPLCSCQMDLGRLAPASEITGGHTLPF
jgi:hypothetical protein